MEKIFVRLGVNIDHVATLRQVRKAVAPDPVAAAVAAEMAATAEMQEIALALRPDAVCIVPEKREEITTEGGLNLADASPSLGELVATLKDAEIAVTAFLDPDLKQIHEAARFRFDAVEMHTGAYANATRHRRNEELKKIKEAADAIRHLGMRVHAGHGLDYHNITPLLTVPHLEEVNIGHSIVARALMVGMDRAVRDMLHLLGRI